MATRAAIATGSAANFLTAGTWGLIDASSYLNAEHATESLLTTNYADSRSAAFAPNGGSAVEISGVAVKLCERLGTTGTMSVELYNSTDSAAVAGTEVTINVADLPSALETDINGGWIFLKFGSPVTLEAAHNYKVEAKTSNASQVDLWCDGTADNLSRFLLTTTTGAPAAGDDLIITKAYTGAGTGTDAIVTMNETATTDYGSTPTAANSLITPGIAICNGGRLVFPPAATSLLKISNSIIVYSGGILAQGIPPLSGTANAAVTSNDTTLTDTRLAMPTNLYVGMVITCNGKTMTVTSNTATVFTGASWSGGSNPGNGNAWSGAGLEIGRAYTSAITFDCGTNVDYGLTVRNLGTFYRQGLSRTIGKNIVSTLASASVTQKTSAAIAATAASPGVFTWASNTLSNGDTIQFSNIRTITGIATFTTYYVVNAGTDGAGKFRISLTNGGGDINTTGSGSSTLIGWATSDVDLDVADDTGWLDNDEVAIASTTRTYTDCEQSVLNGNAAAALLTFDDAMVYGHDGVTPTQAEVILLTRNVKLYGASAALQTYIDIKATAIVDCDWAEDYWLGSATANKRGIDIATTTGTCSFMYCSRHTSPVASSQGWNMSGASGTGLTIQYCVSYNVANYHFTNLATSGSSTVDNCEFIKNRDSIGILNILDVGGILTNITIVGSANTPVVLIETGGVIGTISDLTIHSCSSVLGSPNLGPSIMGTITNINLWRNGTGINLNGTELEIINLVAFGNLTNNVYISQGSQGKIKLITPIINGDTSFPTTNGLYIGANVHNSELTIINGDFGTASGIKTGHTNDINCSALQFARIFLINTKLASGTPVATQNNLSSPPNASIPPPETTKLG
jgi:hypothetical protein